MLNILILCTGNSCRSILGEALINEMSNGCIKAYSAGSHPVGKVNPGALTILQEHGIDTADFSSKSWDEFNDQQIDVVISVCDNAANEVCPVYLGSALRAHWGLPDPAHVTGTDEEVRSAFMNTYTALQRRINKLLELPLQQLSGQQLVDELNIIGKMDD